MGLIELLDEPAPAESPGQAATVNGGGLFDALRNGVEPGARNTTFTRLAGWLRARGASQADIFDWLSCVNAAQLRPARAGDTRDCAIRGKISAEAGKQGTRGGARFDRGAMLTKMAGHNRTRTGAADGIHATG